MAKTCKSNKLKVAKLFKTKRNPFSGSNSHQSMSDTLHEKFYIEMKDGKKSLPTVLWRDTVTKAKQENKIPMLIQHGKNEKIKDARITLRLSDFLTLTQTKEDSEPIMNPPPKEVPQIVSKLRENKKQVVKK